MTSWRFLSTSSKSTIKILSHNGSESDFRKMAFAHTLGTWGPLFGPIQNKPLDTYVCRFDFGQPKLKRHAYINGTHPELDQKRTHAAWITRKKTGPRLITGSTAKNDDKKKLEYFKVYEN